MKRRYTILALIIVISMPFITGCQEETENNNSNSRITSTPYLSFVVDNSPQNLSDATQDDEIAIILLSEGNIAFDDLKIMISADCDGFYEHSGFQTIPNLESPNEWNAGEKVIITEKDAHRYCLDKNGNWRTEKFCIRFVYMPANKMIFASYLPLNPADA